MKRILQRLFCVLLLLVGQEAALTHAPVHAQHKLASAGQQAVLDAGAAEPGKASGERFVLCDFDYAYTQVLGAVHSACLPPHGVAASYAMALPPVHDRAGASELLSHIRGPPALL